VVNTVPNTINAISNALMISLNPEGFFKKKLATGADSFFLSMPGLNQVLMATSDTGASQIFSADTSNLTSSLPSPLQPLLGSYSLLLLQGNTHVQERKMMRPAFQGACLRSYVPLIHDAVTTEISTHDLGKKIDLQTFMHQITLNVIIEVVFGITEEIRKKEYQQAIRKLLHAFSPPIMLFPFIRKKMLGIGPWDRFLKARTTLDTLIYDNIEKARGQNQASNHILSTFVNLKTYTGEQLSHEHIRDELTTLLMAGHETTANSLTWAIYLISTNVSISTILIQEIHSLPVDASIDQIMKLSYLDAVIKEVLRLHPVVPLVLRSVVREHTLMGYKLKAGSYAGIATVSLHMNPKIWTDPELFRPERFIEKNYSSSEYVPFGGGTKKCLGYGFALFEMKSVIFKLYRQTKIEIDTKGKVVASIQGITLGPKQKIIATFCKTNNGNTIT